MSKGRNLLLTGFPGVGKTTVLAAVARRLRGRTLGGFLTDTISWHAIFYINIPVGLFSLAVIWRVMPNLGRSGRRHDLDILGATVFTAAVAPFLIGLTNAQDNDWLSPQVGGLVVLGLVIGVAFLFVETRAREPIIPLGLFRGRTYSASIAATFFASLGFFAAIVFLPLYFQVVLGKSATESGYLSFPLLIGVIVGSIGSGQIVARTGRYRAVICLGAVIRGETPHFDFVAAECARGVLNVSALTGVPATFGVLTTDDAEQALARAGGPAGNKGFDAARAALEMIDLLERLGDD